MIPGALLQPNIATRAKNVTAKMMIEEVMVLFGCWGLVSG
jgi:cyanate permease